MRRSSIFHPTYAFEEIRSPKCSRQANVLLILQHNHHTNYYIVPHLSSTGQKRLAHEVNIMYMHTFACLSVCFCRCLCDYCAPTRPKSECPDPSQEDDMAIYSACILYFFAWERYRRARPTSNPLISHPTAPTPRPTVFPAASAVLASPSHCFDCFVISFSFGSFFFNYSFLCFSVVFVSLFFIPS